MGEVALVCGSRSWKDRDAIRAWLKKLPPGSRVIHGGAKGADSMAGELCAELGIPCRVFPADWKKHGRKAGYLRNIQMLDENPHRVGAFWDGKSRGTNHTIAEARARGIPSEVTLEDGVYVVQ